MSQRALGPQFTTKQLDMWGHETDNDKYVSTIAAYRGKRPVGTMSIDKDAGKIHKLFVQERYRRKGAASAMLEHGRRVVPGLQHSHALSDDGKAFAKAKP